MLRSGITWKEAESVELWYRIGGGVAENQLPPLRKFRNRRKFYTSDDSSDVGCSSNEDDEEDDDSQTLMMAAAVWIFKMTENFCCFVFSFVYYLFFVCKVLLILSSFVSSFKNLLSPLQQVRGIFYFSLAKVSSWMLFCTSRVCCMSNRMIKFCRVSDRGFVHPEAFYLTALRPLKRYSFHFLTSLIISKAYYWKISFYSNFNFQRRVNIWRMLDFVSRLTFSIFLFCSCHLAV